MRVAGLAGLIAGAVSMAAGEYVSMKAQAELLERELELERAAAGGRNPQVETVELRPDLPVRGARRRHARRTWPRPMMADPELALQAHAREELGIDPDLARLAPRRGPVVVRAPSPSAPSCRSCRGSSAAAPPRWSPRWSLAVVAAIVIGAVTARLTDRPAPRIILRQLAFTILPAMVTYAIGSAIGLNV